jgi:tRNA uridine 5-carboxymethylaminomethyl modification enzyme
LTLDRSDAYLGVLVDDLITRGTQEPYRMFTSRAEYRLLLREDNADLRLSDQGHRVGLVDDETYEAFCRKREAIRQELDRLETKRARPGATAHRALQRVGSNPIEDGVSLRALLRRPEIRYGDLAELDPERPLLPPDVQEEVEIQVKYDGYIDRQLRDVERFRSMEREAIPPGLEYGAVHGLSAEVREKLSRLRPVSLGQASRISGVTPAAMAALMVHLRRMREGPAA